MADAHSWNLWHGCTKCSEGCANCYMFMLDEAHNVPKASTAVKRTSMTNRPLERDRYGNFKIPPGYNLRLNMTSDTFVEEADEWRNEMWNIIRQRPDVTFFMLTKRANRIAACLPDDWGDGYHNVELHVSVENQRAFDERWPQLRDIPARHKGFNLAPLLGPVDLTPALQTGQIDYVGLGGECFGGERPCHYEWVKQISDDCKRHNTNFLFSTTGTVFVKDGKTYRINSMQVQKEQAIKSGLSYWDHDIDYEFRSPMDGHQLEDWELAVPKYNLSKCPTCPHTHICAGCYGCSTCRNESHGSLEEVMKLRQSWLHGE